MHLEEQTSPSGGNDIYQKGEIVFGHFEIISFLASGGMGRVYKARDTMRDVNVALKVMLRNVSNTDIVRFQKEARLASKLEHPNIVSITDFRIDNNTPFLVMEYVDGRTLQEVLDAEKALNLKDFIEIFQQIIRALIYAHHRGIVHRDLKPSNIMIRESDDQLIAKILDFGIAKDVFQDRTKSSLTSSNAIVGSPLYLSPEQSRSQPVTFSSDVYALGCVMWHALNGSPPYEANSAMEVLVMHQNSNPAELELSVEIPESLEKLIRSMLSKEPGDRPELSRLLFALDSVEASNQSKNSDEVPSNIVSDVTQRKRPSAFLIGLIAIAIVGTAVGAMTFLKVRTDDRSAPINKPVSAATFYDSTIKAGDAIADEFDHSKGEVRLDKDGTYLRLRSEGLRQLAKFEGNKTIAEVYVHDCKGFTEDQWRILSTFPSLRSLLIFNSTLDNLSGLSKLKGLTKLDVSNCTISDGVLRDIAKLNSLKLLNLAYTKAKGSESERQKSESATDTTGSDHKYERFPSIEILTRMPNLEFINVAHSSITQKQFTKICKMPTITGVKFEQSPGVTQTLASMYKEYPRISFNESPSYIQNLNIKIEKMKPKPPATPDYADVLRESSEAIKIVKDKYGENDQDLRGFYFARSEAALALHKWVLAEESVKKVLQLNQVSKNPDVELAAREVLIAVYRGTNRLKLWESAIKEDIPLLKKRYGEKSLLLANRFVDLGNCENALGDKAASSRNFQLGIDMFTKLGAVERAGMERVALAQCYMEQAKVSLAENECNEVLTAAGSLPSSMSKETMTVGAKSVLASVKCAQGHFNQALKLNSEAFKQSRSFQGADIIGKNLEGQRKTILEAKARAGTK